MYVPLSDANYWLKHIEITPQTANAYAAGKQLPQQEKYLAPLSADSLDNLLKGDQGIHIVVTETTSEDGSVSTMVLMPDEKIMESIDAITDTQLTMTSLIKEVQGSTMVVSITSYWGIPQKIMRR
jgi:hypothetical protein